MRVQRATVPVPTPSGAAECRGELDAHVERLRAGGEPAPEVDAIARAVRTLAELEPGEATARAVRALLEDRPLAEETGSDGRPLRASLVEAQVSLGFPWALEIEPDDLPLLWRPTESVLAGAVVQGGYVLLGLTWVLLFVGVAALLVDALGGGFGHALGR